MVTGIRTGPKWPLRDAFAVGFSVLALALALAWRR